MVDVSFKTAYFGAIIVPPGSGTPAVEIQVQPK
jgi:hypothetical protein